MVDDLSLNYPPFLLRVIVRTRALLAPLNLALDSFIVGRVILLFFPAMTHIAVDSNFAPARVVSDRDVILGLPVEARLHRTTITIG